MGNSDKLAMALVLIALLVFIIVFAILLYYTYSGQNTSTTDDCSTEDIIVDPGTNVQDFINNLKAKDLSIPTSKIVKNNNNRFNLFNTATNRVKIPLRNPNKNVEELTKNIKDSLNSFDKTVREPFVTNGRATKVVKIPDTIDDSFNNRVATRLNSNTSISNDTRSGKLFIIEAMSSIDIDLPKREGLTLKFWNNSTKSHSLKGHVPIFDDSSSCRVFSIQPGQFVIIESLSDIWLITTKTKSGSDVRPTKPCVFNPTEECDFSDSLDTQVNSLLNGGWSN